MGMSCSDEEFIGLLTSAQPALQRFVFANIPDFHECEDILQRVSLVLWKKFSQYKPDSSFQTWAIGVARFEILRARRIHARNRVILSDELAEKAASYYSTVDIEREQAFQEALDHCIRKLPARYRDLIARRYTDKISCKALARKLGMKAERIRTRLFRIRERLRACIMERVKESHTLSSQETL